MVGFVGLFLHQQGEVVSSELPLDRCRQGRMASSDSQRQMVVPEMSATIPWAMTSVAMSGMCRRDRGTPSRAGNSQARALTATTTSGGKDRRSAASGALVQTRQALLEEAFAPLGHDLPASVQAQSDLVVVVSLGGHEDDLGANHISIRQRIATRPRLQLSALIAGQAEHVWAFPRNGIPSEGRPYVTGSAVLRDRSYVPIFMAVGTKTPATIGHSRLVDPG